MVQTMPPALCWCASPAFRWFNTIWVAPPTKRKAKKSSYFIRRRRVIKESSIFDSSLVQRLSLSWWLECLDWKELLFLDCNYFAVETLWALPYLRLARRINWLVGWFWLQPVIEQISSTSYFFFFSAKILDWKDAPWQTLPVRAWRSRSWEKKHRRFSFRSKLFSVRNGNR